MDPTVYSLITVKPEYFIYLMHVLLLKENLTNKGVKCIFTDQTEEAKFE